jgi:hypothetical protein
MDLHEQLADTTLALLKSQASARKPSPAFCTAGLECKLYRGTASRHAVALHEVVFCEVCGQLSDGMAHSPSHCDGYIQLRDIFSARARMTQGTLRAFPTTSGPLSGKLPLHLIKYLNHTSYVIARDGTPVAWYVPNDGHAYGAHPAIWYVVTASDFHGQISRTLASLPDVKLGNIMVIKLDASV